MGTGEFKRTFALIVFAQVFCASHVSVARASSLGPREAFSSPEAALLLVSTKKSRPLAWSNTGSPRFTDLPSLCACSESSLTNLIGSGFNLLCSQSHSKTECRWTRPEVLGADQKERGLWGRECARGKVSRKGL